MIKNINLVFTVVFVLLSLLLCGGVEYSISKLHSLREEYDVLNAETTNSTGTITSLEARNSNLKRISYLSINKATAVPDAVVFFSMLRQLMELHNISLLYVATSGQTDAETKDNILQVKFDGDYYEIIKMLADIRELPAAARITRMSLKRNHNLPEELVEVDLTLEVITEE